MPLDIKTHQTELQELSKALGHIRQGASTASRDYWTGQKHLADILAAAIDSFDSWTPKTLKLLHLHCEDLASLSHSLIDRVSTAQGKRFWHNQKEHLYGLADLITDRLVIPQPQPQTTH